jgi:glycosyltransferase involved in cell wall biosynthesis
MWRDQKISVVLPTYNERDSIRQVIRDLEVIEYVDEIIVINNNAAEGTSEEVAGTSAIEILEETQGYGAAMQRGFRESTGDLIAVFEPDGTFVPRDIFKLLAYSEDFDVVYGSRTVKEFIWQGANMGIFLKWGNYSVAKLMEVLFNSTSLTDVGCTVRCINRSTMESLQPFFTVKGNFFGPEMMVLSILQKHRVVQIPVNYTRRVGTSSVTGNPVKAFSLGLQMIWLIWRYRLKSWFFPGRFRTGNAQQGTQRNVAD